MALNRNDPETERLARLLAEKNGETITLAIRRALEERLHRMRGRAEKEIVLKELATMRRRLAALPVLDHRSADDSLGYDENGLPSEPRHNPIKNAWDA
jgi:antitoxin VapB